MANIITAGKLTDFCSIENPVKTADDAGGHSELFEYYVRTKCLFVKKEGFRATTEGYDRIISEYTAYIFWRHDFDTNITKDSRFVWNNRILAIVDFSRYEKNKKLLKFVLVEGT
jgi:head-tail adaptor